MAPLGDLGGDGTLEVAVGAPERDGLGGGEVWVLSFDCVVPATAEPRTMGANPSSLTADAPVVGQTASLAVDLAGTTGHSLAWMLVYPGPGLQPTFAGQYLLVDTSQPAVMQLPVGGGPVAQFEVDLPPAVDVCGATLSLQALHVGAVWPIGYSNAVDWTVGI